LQFWKIHNITQQHSFDKLSHDGTVATVLLSSLRGLKNTQVNIQEIPNPAQNLLERYSYPKQCRKTSHSKKKSVNQTRFKLSGTISITTKRSKPIVTRRITCFHIFNTSNILIFILLMFLITTCNFNNLITISNMHSYLML
jgi:hypothetical protein